MALKKILESVDGLDEAIVGLYEKKADGKFHLGLEDDDAEPLRRAKEHEVGLRQLTEKERDELRNELATAKNTIVTLEAAQSKTTQDLRLDHEVAIRKLNEENAKKNKALEDAVKQIRVDDVADRISKEIGIDDGAAELLAGALKSRLVVEMVNGTPVTRVLTKDGSASNMSPDDLKAEYLQSEKYAGILRASEASGGGASNGKVRSGAPKALSDMSEKERTEMARLEPERFSRLVAEQGGIIPHVVQK